MGVADLRAAFAEGNPAYNCTKASLAYRNHGGQQFQILSFSGTGPDGKEFKLVSEPLAAGVDVNQVAREMARKLSEGGTP